MKIEYLQLKNFASIYMAFHSKEISIDFTKSKNRIILITGPNGSGKTSILSNLHPFATHGNMDVRNELSLIRENKEGYKEIHINDQDNIYVIKHFYTPTKTGHSVKSYMIRNGLELNPNGNVTSFKELVKQELDIEQDYMKLARLGNNVTNFIDLKTTERKSFMGKILSETEIYLQYNKKIMMDLRETRSLIDHLVDSIEKLKIGDEDSLISYQKSLKKEIEKCNTEISKINGELNIIDYRLKEFDNPLIIRENIVTKKKELDKVYKVIHKNSSEDLSREHCLSMITELETSLASLQTSLVSLQEKRNDKLNTLDKLLQESKDLTKELSKIEDNADIKDTKYMIETYKESIEKRNKELHITSYEKKVSKKDMEDLIVTLDRCWDILQNVFEFGKGPIRKACDYIARGENISHYVESHNATVYKNKMQATCEYVYANVVKSIGNIKPNCVNPECCKVKEFYDMITDYATEVPDVEIEDETFVTYSKMAYQNIRTMISYVKEKKDIIEKLDKKIQDMFILKNVLDKIMSMEKFYDSKIIYEELSMITEYELQEEDLHQLSLLKEKLSLQMKSISNSDYFKSKKDSIDEEISDIRDEINDIMISITNTTANIGDITDKLENYKDLLESVSKKEDIEKEYHELSDNFELVRKLYEDKKVLTEELSRSTFSHDNYEKEYRDIDSRLNTFHVFSKQLSIYKEEYEDLELIKRATSSKEGIPLFYMNIYLKDVKEITNDLLYIIYEDDLYIDDFSISADEFAIPYIKEEKVVKDVSYASDGEKSFISLALSFALIFKALSNYNIMLLDEVDATLDTKNREKFLLILERISDMIGSEQIFAISHNNMFNMCPVDIVSTLNETNADNPHANYIKINIK